MIPKLKMYKYTILFLTILLMTSCSGFVAPVHKTIISTQIINKPYDKTWIKFNEFAKKNKMVINETDSISGKITGVLIGNVFGENNLIDDTSLCDCGYYPWYLLEKAYNSDVILKFNINKISNNETKVVVNLDWHCNSKYPVENSNIKDKQAPNGVSKGKLENIIFEMLKE